MKNMLQNKKGISLIVLAITILVMGIIAGVVITNIQDTSIIQKAKESTFKSDMQSYSEMYQSYLVSRFANDLTFSESTLTVEYGDEEFTKIFGSNVPEKYAEGLKVVNGKFAYITDDSSEEQIVSDMNMTPDPVKVKNILSNCTTNNSVTNIEYGATYTAIITPTPGKTISNVLITMGGEDITNSVWDAATSTITIPSVTKNIIINITTTMGDYIVNSELTHCTSSNTDDGAIGNSSYSTTLTAAPGYTMENATVLVEMNGENITSTVYNSTTHTVSISNVTGNIVITVVALADRFTATNNLLNCTTSNSTTTLVGGAQYTAKINPSNGYTLTGATYSISMGGVDITSTSYNSTTGDITIAEVIGNVSITVNAKIVNYSITYNLDGGSVATANTASYNILSESITLNNPTKSGHIFNGWTGSNGVTPQTVVTIPTGSTGNKNYVANWIENTVNITVNKDGAEYSGLTVALYSGTTSAYTNPTYSNGIYTFSRLANGTYNVYIGGEDTGKDVEVTSLGGENKSINYFTLTLKKGEGISSVSGGGIYLNGSVANISAVTNTDGGYSFSSWTKTSGVTPVSTTSPSTTVTITEMTVLTANATDSTNPVVSITRTDYNTFSFTVTDNVGVTGYAITTSNSTPTSWTTTGTLTSGSYDITGEGTYYVWAKDNEGNIGHNTITAYTVSRSQGVGSTLTTRYDATSSTTGTAFTSSIVLLDGTSIWASSVANAGYSSPVLKHGTTSMTESGSSYIVSATETILSSATANTNTAYTVVHKKMDLDGTNYTVADTDNLTGTTATSVTPSVKSYTGFTAPSTQTVTIAGDGSTTVTYLYTRNKYTFTLGTATGVTTTGSTSTGDYYYGATITLAATANTGYTWSQWTSSNTSLVANTATVNTTFTMPAGAITMTPSASDITKPTVTIARTDYNTFSWSASDGVGVTGYAITTSSSTPSSWTTTGTLTSGTYDISTATTYYVWAKDSAGNVSNSASITAYTVSRSQGAGSTLTTKYDSTGSSNGTAFTSSTVMLAGTSVWASSVANTGYNTATLKHGSTTMTASGSAYTVGASETITSSASANTNTAYTVIHKKMNLDGTNYTVADTDNLTGTTATSVTPSVKTYTGFTAPSTQTVTIAADGSTTVTYLYTRNKYTFTLGSTAGVTTTGSTSTGNYYYGATITLAATANTGYTWSQWTSSNTSLVANTATANTTFTMPAGAITMTPSASDVTKPTVTVTRSDYNTFSWTASDTVGVTGYAITTSSTAPSSWTTTGTLTSGTYDISTATTYYVWAKDSAGNVSDSASITAYTVSRSQGTGSTLTTRYDSTGSSNGTAFTSSTVMLAGTSIWASSVANTGYNTATLKHGSTTMTASGAAYTVGASETITSGATINAYTVTYTLTNATKSAGATSVNYNASLSATVAANTGYTLPSSITVTIGGSNYTGFTYTQSTGAISIPTNAINGNVVITVTATDTTKPTVSVTRSDYNTFSWTASDSVGVTGYAITDSSATPSTWTTTGTLTSGSYDISSAKTYYVWAKDAAGNTQYSTITAYTVSRSVGTGTTLTTKYDSTSSSSGTAFTSSTVMLAGTSVWASSTANTGYNTATLKHGSTTMTASGSSYTVGASETITSSARANTNTAYTVIHKKMNLDGTTYTTDDTQNLTGTTGASVTPSVKTYTGFTAPSTQTVTIAADGSTTVTYQYTRNKYTFTLGSATGVTTTGSSSTGTYYYGATITLKASVNSAYNWSKWTSGNTSLITDQTATELSFAMPAGNISMTPTATLKTYTITKTLSNCTVANSSSSATYGTSYSATVTPNTGYSISGASVSVTMGGTNVTSSVYNSSTGAISISSVTGNIVITATCYDKTAPTVSVTRSDYNTFSWSASDGVGVTGYAITTSSTTPSSWTTTGTLTSGTYDISSATTYYVWAKDAAGNVSTAASITAYTVSRSQGTGSTLTTRLDSTSSSSGTAFTSSTVMLAGTSVWASAVANTGYNTATLKHGSTTMTASGSYYSVGASETITSSASANTNTAYTVIHKKMNLDGTTYTTTDTQNLTGTTGASVTPAVKSYEGFTAPSTQTKTIAADGSTTITYQYTRNKYTFTLGSCVGVSTDGSSPTGSYYYGEMIYAYAHVEPGYTWSKWIYNDGLLVGYNPNTWEQFTMPPVNISMTPSATPSTITYSLSNVTKTSGPSSVNGSQDIAIIVTANSGYALPDSITVTVGGSNYPGYSYTKSTGEIFISSLYITGDVVITVIGEKTVPYDGTWYASKGVNSPKLLTGMTGVYWDSSGNEVTVTDSNYENWYDYSNQKWANAKTADGSYWVWIPRYAYEFESGRYTRTAGTISIKFLQGTTNLDSTNTTISKAYPSSTGSFMLSYVVHPAFIDDSGSNYMHGGWDAELPGIWVAKYEMSNDGSSKIISVPGVGSWRSIRIGYAYTKCITYMPSAASHLMKNSEWGAVAYLAQSSFGRNGTEITMNSSTARYTGGSQNATANTNPLQSTTGNASGIYDMRGGADEYVAAYISNGKSNLSYGSEFADTSALTTGYQTLSTKFITVYPYNSSSESSVNNYTKYKNALNGHGDAILETSTSGSGFTSWFSVYSYFAYGNYPFLIRGGNYGDSDNSGIFCFNYSNGNDDSGNISFRAVLAGI